MAYPLDVDAQNAGLTAWFGDDRGAQVPSSWEVALFTAHPNVGGVELGPDGGYAREVVANTSANFPDPVDALIRSADIPWPDPTDEYSDVATTYVLIDAADSTTRWYVGQLGAPVDVTEAGPGFTLQLAIRWNTEGA